MVIGSPSICALRIFNPDVIGATTYAVKLAKTIIDRFNTKEATARIEPEYGKIKMPIGKMYSSIALMEIFKQC